MINQEKEDLAALLTNPGFIRLREWINDEFVKRCMDDIEKAYEITDATEREHRIRQIFAGKRTATMIAHWPEARLAQLASQQATAAVTDTGFQRGGYRA